MSTAAAPIESSTLALLALRCPRCHQGKLFTYPATSITKFMDMPAECLVCGQTYEPEPGFYYGAMYISFGFALATFAVVGVLLYYFFGDPATWVYVVVVAIITLLSTPLVFRYSRALMLYLFGGARYDATRAARKTR